MSALCPRIRTWVLTCGLVVGCGELGAPTVGDDPEGIDVGLRGPDPVAVVVPLRRLTRTQLHHTLHDLLGDALPPSLDVRSMLPPDDEHGGFSSNSTVVPSELTVAQIERAMEEVVAGIPSRRGRLDPCLDTAEPTPQCMNRWVDDLAPRAWRRPLPVEELEALHALARIDTLPAGVEQDAVDAAIERVLLALLLSPDFLYRLERGEPTTDPTVVALTSHEIAARLSYLLWSSMPDDALRIDADEGRLADPVVRLEHFERMFEDPRARDGLVDFHVQWLELSSLDSLDKDRNLFPTWSEALRPLMRQETSTFVDYVLRHDDGRLATLLSSRMTFVSPALLPWYGDEVAEVEPPSSLWRPEGTVAVELSSEQRSGILSRIAPLAVHAHASRSDPVGRGALVRRRLLCETLATAPADVPMGTLEPAQGSSQREQLERHAHDPACAVCHARIDPVGLALESYDAMGMFREEDAAGNPVDARGAVPDSDIHGPVDGPVALQRALAQSEQVLRCHARQWLRHALGRAETPEDDALVERLTERFVASDGHVPTLLRTLVGSEAFTMRRIR